MVFIASSLAFLAAYNTTCILAERNGKMTTSQKKLHVLKQQLIVINL